MTVHRLSAGNGFRYLLRNTASADVERDSQLPLAEYYASSGNPAGRWLGSGLADLAEGQGVTAGSAVSEAAMTAVFGNAADPVTGAALGRGFPHRIGADGVLRAVGVAGFDLTLTVPKSVSVVWALGDARTRAAVVAAHHCAIDQVIDVLEARVVATRVGHAGASRVTTRGVIAAAFDHPDTRQADPNLHTHVVVANRVQGPDEKWRAIDARPLFAATVTLSETYDALLTDELARTLPVAFGWRDRGPRRTPAFEVDGVDDQLLRLFSTRAAAISTHLDRLVVEFTAEHGRGPSRVETIRLRQTATLTTRPVKTTHPWSDLLTSWAQRARTLTGQDPRDLLGAALNGQYTRPLRARDVGFQSRSELAALAIVGVQERRSTWSGWNLEAEIARVTKQLTMASPKERARLHAAVLRIATGNCVPLHSPDAFADRWTQMTRRWSSTTILDAETRLLQVANQGFGPATPPRLANDVAANAAGSGEISLELTRRGMTRLAPDQAAAMVQICTSGRGLDVLVGPAGSGKTSTLRAVKVTWAMSRTTADVIGLAPSAAAAQQLSDALGTRCETTAKWLYETLGPAGQRRAAAIAELDAQLSAGGPWTTAGGGRHDTATRRRALVRQQEKWRLQPGQLLIVDEASLAGTLELDHLVTQAQAAGAKVLLVGDQQQLSAVQAGGAFGLLARRTQTAELTGPWRFQNRWEAHATRLLRDGEPAALDAYRSHHRLHSGFREDVLDAAYNAWRTDTEAGRDALLVAADNATVTELNARGRSDAILTGRASRQGVELCDGITAGVGDRIITRRNDRRLPVGEGDHVRNGNTWVITSMHLDGSVSAQLINRANDKEPTKDESRHNDNNCRPQVVLPADYVAEHVDLGYAITAQRVQSRTVDTAHVITGPGMSREHLYVALSRGRHANHAYTPLDDSTGEEAHLRGGSHSVSTDQTILEQILTISSAEPSATESLEAAGRPQPHLVAARPQISTLQWQTNDRREPDRPSPSM
ncbi:MAG: relaxase domain-containing protein [Candidatus Nanopelagicales bacterium]|nr:relaxase domain-containing protein [Candidatus Nanopelagicales bacterium]